MSKQSDEYGEWAHPLFLAIQSDRATHEAARRACERLAVVVGRAAERLAAANAEWHDDPAGDPVGHAKMHASAEVQYPPDVRQRIARELLDYMQLEGGVA